MDLKNIALSDLVTEVTSRMRERPRIVALTKETQTLRHELAAMTADRDTWKQTAESYAGAWQRELGPYGIRNKTHLIDALVLTTRNLVAGYKTWVDETEAMRERRRQEDVAKTLGWTGELPVDREQV